MRTLLSSPSTAQLCGEVCRVFLFLFLFSFLFYFICVFLFYCNASGLHLVAHVVSLWHCAGPEAGNGRSSSIDTVYFTISIFLFLISFVCFFSSRFFSMLTAFLTSGNVFSIRVFFFFSFYRINLNFISNFNHFNDMNFDNSIIQF